ncbi:beta-galactosidase [Haloferula helveola]|uniref:Beta-galactosidase n=1 Tax=Haloferula helveola TaxID=490095 RepID=A0ABN6H832_9BACT|nr:beta-galactosidase [Haloferula helveola]
MNHAPSAIVGAGTGIRPARAIPTLSHRRGWWIAVAALLMVSCLDALRADPVQRVDLSGEWDFSYKGASAGERVDTEIEVPGGGWYKQGFRTSEADYSRTIHVPDRGAPQVTILKFGAVNYQADLFVDGRFVATSTQAYTPASFDITGHVTPGSDHQIRLHVKGHDALLSSTGRSLVPNGAGSWAKEFLPQGIFRSAELLIYPELYIADAFVRPYVSNTSLCYDVWIRNASDEPRTVALEGSLSSWNGDAWPYPSLPKLPIKLQAKSTTKVTVGPVSWDLGAKSYWWPNVPYQEGYTAKLHDLHLSLSGGASHEKSVRFGFRECRQENNIYTLNGCRVNFRGDSLQGANYDRIDHDGQGNAFDTYPGFLPGPEGWPKAVDNFQRLNYNVVRIHQIPASPYMLDVCDEMGLMIIDETGIRGAGDQQDFIEGRENMVNHVRQLFARDRNHASVVRLSISNEPDWSATDSVDFQEALYAAAMEVDGTRPISIDAAEYDYQPGSKRGGLGHANFSCFRHYGTDNRQWGRYTDEVFSVANRPFGSGEHLWDRDNTAQGFLWFATSTANMRIKGASDIRPYTLLSAWASVIPGTRTRDMRLENPPWNDEELYPLYGEDNLPDPWANPQIRRVQAGFHPMLVADAAYWDTTRLSNTAGDWPAHPPYLSPGSEVARSLSVFNDMFHGGTSVEVSWALRNGSADGELEESGSFTVNVPYGYKTTEQIRFTTPDVPNGTPLYLVLSASKEGVEVFREENQCFVAGAYDLPDGIYKLVNRNSGKALTAQDGLGGNVEQRMSVSDNAQKWRLKNLGGNRYHIMNVASSRYLDVYGDSFKDGANVAVWDATAKPNQEWTIEFVGSGFYTLRAAHSNRCLDVFEASNANGANVVQWTGNGGANQQWAFESQ